MANEPLALAIRPPNAPEDDYFRLCALLSQNARGRAFLAEHARRSRAADQEALLAAITRIEARLKEDGSAVQRLRDDSRMLVTAIRLARPEIDAAGPATRAAKLGKLIDLLEDRIDAMAAARPAALTADEAPEIGATMQEAEPARPEFVVVPLPDEPELPIPSPKRFAPRPVPAPATIAVREAAVTTEVVVAQSAPPHAVAAARPADPLAALLALSEEERLALFS